MASKMLLTGFTVSEHEDPELVKLTITYEPADGTVQELELWADPIGMDLTAKMFDNYRERQDAG